MNFFTGSSPDFFSLKLQIKTFGLFHVLVSPGCQEQGSAGKKERAGRCLWGRGTVSKVQCLVLHLGVQQMSRVADGCPMSMLMPPGLSKPLVWLVPSPSPVPGGRKEQQSYSSLSIMWWKVFCLWIVVHLEGDGVACSLWSAGKQGLGQGKKEGEEEITSPPCY